jgi:hypothetical protein
MKRSMLWLVLLGILAMGLAAGPDLWAAPAQSPGRQTVPTRTPQPSPTKPPPKAKPTLVPTTTMEANSPSVEPSDPLLPQAGGRSIRPLLVVALVTAGFLTVATVRRFA